MNANKLSAVVDTQLIMKDAGLVGASAAAQVGGSAKVIDLMAGAGTSPTPGMAAAPDTLGIVLIDVTALEIASDNEIYDIIVQGSPDSNFGTAGNIVELAQLSLSAKEVKRSDSDKDDVVGRYLLPFLNKQAGVAYRYVRLYTVVGGTVATGINYSAHLVRPQFGVGCC